jgi:hypothetical protein
VIYQSGKSKKGEEKTNPRIGAAAQQKKRLFTPSWIFWRCVGKRWSASSVEEVARLCSLVLMGLVSLHLDLFRCAVLLRHCSNVRWSYAVFWRSCQYGTTRWTDRLLYQCTGDRERRCRKWDCLKRPYVIRRP